MPDAVAQTTGPAIPASLYDAGLPDHLVEELVLKSLFLRKEQIGANLASQLGLPFSLIEELMVSMQRRQLIHALRSQGIGNVSNVYALTEAGADIARRRSESSQYGGKAPVPAAQYREWAIQQKRQKGWLKPAVLKQGLANMVTTPKLLVKLGPAMNAGKCMLLYGYPGNGKTMLVETLENFLSETIFIPHAIMEGGEIIEMYDPVYHKRVDDAEDNDIYTSVPAFDQRWYRIRRPFIISGGELTLDSLDLGYSDALGYYTAPLQLKANNGIYVIDDLGRQRVTAREVLNRWIVPMEQGVDFLSFRSGSKISLPFAAFLIFSTNLNPGDISDEAFLRRIQYKLLIRDPDAEEFTTIFRRCCDSLKLDCPEEILEDFLQGHYAKTGKPMRRCHPRDILEHAVNLIEFRELPYQLTGEILDEAFDSCFLEDLH